MSTGYEIHYGIANSLEHLTKTFIGLGYNERLLRGLYGVAILRMRPAAVCLSSAMTHRGQPTCKIGDESSPMIGS